MQKALVRRTALLLLGMAAFQALLIAIFHDVFLPPLVAHTERTTPLGWALAALVAGLYILYSVRGLPTIGRYLWTFSPFKLTGFALAVPAAILEEVFFRAYLMNALSGSHPIVQIAVSAIAFGVAHAVWAIRGGWPALAGAVGSTTLMGAGLAIVYLASNRVVLPCVLSHFVITFVLEPWLLYAYIERAAGRKPAAVSA